MNRYEVSLSNARGAARPPVVLSTELWEQIRKVAIANGAPNCEGLWRPFDARQFSAAVRRGLAKSDKPRAAPVHVRPHVPQEWQSLPDLAAPLKQESNVGVVEAVLDLFSGPDGVLVERVTNRNLRALAPR